VSASSTPLVATLGPFTSRFEVEAVLGRGGYGTVVRALDRKQGRKVALKLPHAADAQSLLAIKREFRVLAGVSHPNLVAFHELFVGPNEWFFSMELVRGMDVLQWVERAGTGSLVEVARGLALGLAHLHALGILHGDLKPSNAWVDARGTPVLLDFGLARHDAGRTSNERLVGTLGFLAPELFSGAPPSASSDLYALGVLLVELLTGRPAFEGSGAQIVGRKLLGPPLVIEPVRAGAPSELVAVAEALVSREPSARPSAAEVAARLGQRAAPTSIAPTESEVLFGRDRELEAMAAARARIERGAPEIVFVEGPAGIGKTTLLDRFASTASRDGLLVLRARCSEHESVPFQALDGAVDALATRLVSDDALREAIRDPRAPRAVAALFPVFEEVVAACDDGSGVVATEAVAAPERRRLAARALATVLAEASRVRPVVVLIDDAHWADEDGARLLEEVLDALSGASVLFVIGHRSGESHGPLSVLLRVEREASRPGRRRLEGRLRASRIVVAPLEPSHAREMLASTASLLDERRAPTRPSARDDALVEATLGSPFLLEAVALAGADLFGDLDTTPERLLERAVSARLEPLDADSRRLFEIVCLAGRPISHDLVAEALGLDADVLSLRRLVAARLVRTTPIVARRGESRSRDIALEPYHDHLRRIVREGLDDERRVRLHRAIAAALGARGRVDGEDTELLWRCLHLRGAGELASAARLASEGGWRAARALAFAQAADLFGFAIAHHEGERGERRRMEVARAEALANAGRGRDAAEQYLKAAEGSRVEEEHELSRLAAEQLLRAGYFAEGTRILEQVLRSADVGIRRTPLRAIASLVANRRWLARRGLVPAPTTGRAPAASLRAIDALASGAMGLSVVDSIRSADMMSEALRRALEAGDRTRLGASLSWHAAFAANEGGPSERTTRAILARAREETEAHGDAYARGCLAAASGMTEFHLGHFGAARAFFEQGIRVFERETHGTTKETSTLHIFHHATLALAGRLDELSRRTEERERISEARGERYALVNFRQGLMILRWLAADEPARAEEDLSRAMRGLEVPGFVVQHWFDVWGRVVVLLYRRRSEEARSLWESARGRVIGSLLLRTQFTRVQSYALETFTAAGRLEGGGLGPLSRARLGAWARAAIARAASEDRAWARALGGVLESCLLASYGELSRARAQLAPLVAELDRTELGLYASLVAHRLGAEDGAHAARARRWAEQEGVVRLDALADAIVPGLAPLALTARRRSP
jgi:hypothetical protein